MWFFTLIILPGFFCFGHSGPIQDGQDVGKVLQNGDKVTTTGQTEFPYMAHITIYSHETENGKRILGKSDCGAVIISTNAVLTAANCITDTVSKPIMYVQAGFVHSTYDSKAAQKSWASGYTIHDGFEEEYEVVRDIQKFTCNVAIIWLQKPFVFGPTVKSALLTDFDGSFENSLGWILGWGTNVEGKRMEMLQKAQSRVISNEECQNLLPHAIISPDIFCLMSDNKLAISCDGDSGGPFVVDGVVYGISSFGFKVTKNGVSLCDASRPEVYTHLGYYESWIEETLVKGPPSAIPDNSTDELCSLKPKTA